MFERLAIAGVLWAASLGVTGWWFHGVGRDQEIATQAREDKIAKTAADASQTAAAVAISKIEVQRVEITQPVLREVRTKTVYLECKHTPDGLRGVNAALTGRTAEPARGGQLPAASAAGR
jgi:hypothetical protein